MRQHMGELAPDDIQSIYNQAYRYQYAAEQDRNVIIAFLHNSYAAALTDILGELASDDEISEALDGDFRLFREQVLDFQKRLQKKGEEFWERAKESGLVTEEDIHFLSDPVGYYYEVGEFPM